MCSCWNDYVAVGVRCGVHYWASWLLICISAVNNGPKKKSTNNLTYHHSKFHRLQNTNFLIVKLLNAVHMSDYLSEQAVLCGTRKTRPFSNTQ